MLNLNRKRLSRAIWDTLFDGLEDLPWQRIPSTRFCQLGVHMSDISVLLMGMTRFRLGEIE